MLLRKYMILFVFLILIVSSCSKPMWNYDNNIIKAETYLVNHFDKERGYDDWYLRYVYRGENLSLNLTYRKLDSFFDLYWLRNATINTSLIQYQIDYSVDIIERLSKIWENKTFRSIKNPKGEIALDTYCIEAFITKNEKMTRNINNSLTGLRWLNFRYSGIEDWRNIADETWCVMALANFKYNNVNELYDNILNRTEEYIHKDKNKNLINAVLLHTVMLNDVLNDNGFNRARLNKYMNNLYNATFDDELGYMIKLTILDILINSNYDLDKIKKSIDNILKDQKEEGYLEQEGSKAFDLLRLLILLDDFKKRINN